MKKNDNILIFENLASFKNVKHGFSTSFFGSMRPSREGSKDSLKKFAQAIGVSSEQIVRMKQIHSNTIYWATEKDCGQVIDQTDGLLTDTKQGFLSVVVGDCVPLLFYDPQKKFVAAVHAGWRGLFNEIIKQTVSSLITKGSKPSDIVVGIGPCIRSCCYDIAKEHKEKLLEKFPDWKTYIFEREEQFFLDLPGIAISQLQSVGISLSNIEDGDHCTFENDDVYSSRREGSEFGEIIGIIGLL